jgi:hypothetical protein
MTPRKTLGTLLAATLLLAAATGPSLAGEIAVEGLGGYLGLTATNSAKAAFDSSGGFAWGGGGRFAFASGLYVAAGVRSFSKEGERVFVAGPGQPVASLGHPLSIRVTPILLTAGYRFRQGKMIVPYAGAGGSLTSYREESMVAGLDFDESSTKAGFHLVGGVEVGRGTLRFGAEASWSTVPNAVGLGGVSEVYGEDDLGGWTLLGKVVVAFGGGKKDDWLPDNTPHQ